MCRMSALSATLIGFGLILLLARLRVPLWGAIFLGAVSVGAMFGARPLTLIRYVGEAAVWSRTLGMMGIISILLVLSEAMRRGGQMERIVELARTLLRRPVLAMVALPALIGMLPMPGGALFSAPMVQSAAGKSETDGGRLSAVNYWFRHILEYWWPLYPGVILASQTTGRTLGQLALFHIPLTVFMVVSGLGILAGLHPDLHARAAPPPPGVKRKLIVATSSIWIVLLVWLAGRGLLLLMPADRLPAPWGDLAGNFFPVGLGLAVALLWTVRLNRFGWRDVGRLVWRRQLLSLEGLIFSVLVFQYMLRSVNAAEGINAELVKYHVPRVLIVVALPFIAGMVTGAAMGFVGTSFPIIVAAVAGEPSIVPYVALAYAAGHMGQMLSPLHLCHVVSNRFFNTPFRPVYRHIGPAAAITSLLTAAYCTLLWWLMR